MDSTGGEAQNLNLWGRKYKSPWKTQGVMRSEVTPHLIYWILCSTYCRQLRKIDLECILLREMTAQPHRLHFAVVIPSLQRPCSSGSFSTSLQLWVSHHVPTEDPPRSVWNWGSDNYRKYPEFMNPAPLKYSVGGARQSTASKIAKPRLDTCTVSSKEESLLRGKVSH